ALRVLRRTSSAAATALRQAVGVNPTALLPATNLHRTGIEPATKPQPKRTRKLEKLRESACFRPSVSPFQGRASARRAMQARIEGKTGKTAGRVSLVHVAPPGDTITFHPTHSDASPRRKRTVSSSKKKGVSRRDVLKATG